MSMALVFLLLGLGNGAVFAALGLALVVTYRSSGVVNFSTGAVALYVAYTYAFLRNGELLIPIPGLPQTVHLSNSMGFVPALAISLVIAAALGALLYALVFRPLRTAPAAAKAVASIGIMILVQALLAARVGTNPVSVSRIFPRKVYHVGSSPVPGDRVWFAVSIVALAVLLSVWFRFTRFGLATRAAAESEKGALVSGLSPERIAVVNWALSVAIAGLSGILIAPIIPLTPISYTLFIVPALAAALVGNFTRIPITVAAGLLIGMLQSELTYVQARRSTPGSLPSHLPNWLPKSGLAELVPLVVILVYLIFGGQRLPSRGAIIQQTLGRAPRPNNLIGPGAGLAVIALIGILATHGTYRAAIILSLTFGVISLSQVVVTGFTGQISLAQLTLAGAAAFALTRIQHQLHVPFPISPILAALAAMAIGVLVGLPALRIRGLPVAVATLALAVAVEALWFDNPQLNGSFKGAPIKDATFLGINLAVGSGKAAPRVAFGVMVLIVLLLVAAGVALLRRGRLGASMLAVRANERSAAAAGIDVARTKVIAFAIGGFIAGLGGCLLAYQQTVANASSFTAIGGIGLFATAYLAGVTSVSGGILAGIIGSGGLLFTFLNDKLSSVGPYYATIMALLLLYTVIDNPEGIIGKLHEQAAWVRRKLSRRTPVVASVEGKPTPTLSAQVPVGAAAANPTEIGETILSVGGVGVRYGGVVALDAVTFDVRAGEIVGLIGPNGAGKTTLIDAVSGYAGTEGSVRLGNRDLHGLKPHQRSRSGLGRTFQGIELYDDLTVRENVEVGTTAARYSERGAPSAEDLERYYRILHLDKVADVAVRELSVGQRQLVSVARALAGRPKIVLLDEPAAGLDSTESHWLGERLRAIRDAGITIVMVDHDMNLVLEVCDRIVVLDLGKKIADGTPSEIMRTPEVTRAYLGTTHATAGTSS